MKKEIYKVVDLIKMGKGYSRKISGFELRLPTGFHNYFEKDYELNNINFINNWVEEGMTIIDIGAHIGLLSIIFAKKVKSNGSVFCFEPTPSTFNILKKTIAINKSEAVVKPFQKAVAEKKGKAFFYVTDIEAHNSNSLSDNKRGYGNEHTIEVDITSIDVFANENKIREVGFIKIDAEGAEYSVLKGCRFVLQKNKPKIILSLHPLSILNFGNSLEEIWDLVQEFDYKVIYKSEQIGRDFFIRQQDLFDVFLV